MSKVLVNYHEQSLDEILGSLTKGQRSFICARLMGMDDKEARKLVELKTKSTQVWSYQGEFKDRLDYLMANIDTYRKQAMAFFVETAGREAIEVLSNLVSMGLEWDTLKREDKPFVMQAAMTLSKTVDTGTRKVPYDEWLKRVTIEERRSAT